MIVALLIYRSKKKDSNVGILEKEAVVGGVEKSIRSVVEDAEETGIPTSVEDIEKSIRFEKEESIFSLEHFDDPHFIDVQNAFDVMEANYFRLKQRFFHTPEKVLEIAKDWYRYVEALSDLKRTRVILDVDVGDGVWDRMEEGMKEPLIIQEVVEKKFKSLLGEDWQDIPPDYFKRMETMKKPDGKVDPEFHLNVDEWKYYYRDSVNLYKLEEKRQKEKKEQETKKGEEKESKKFRD